MQWFKRFFEMNVQNLGDYDPVAQRLKGKGKHYFIYIIINFFIDLIYEKVDNNITIRIPKEPVQQRSMLLERIQLFLLSPKQKVKNLQLLQK